jgi:hypothetical protein
LRRQRLGRRQRLDEAAMRDGVIGRERGAVVRRQGRALDVLDQPPAVLRVGENADREIALGHDLEQQDVAGKRPPVRGHAQRTDRAQMPSQPDVVVRARLAQLRSAHPLERGARQHALAVGGGAVAQVELRVREQVGDAQADTARRHADRRREGPLQRRRTLAAIGVSGGEAIDDEVARGGAGVREAERREHQLARGAVDRRPRHRFDHASRHAEAGVVVAPHRRGRVARTCRT